MKFCYTLMLFPIALIYLYSTNSLSFLFPYFLSLYSHLFLLGLLSLFILIFIAEFLWYHYCYLTIIYNYEFNLVVMVLTNLFIMFFYFPGLIIPALSLLVFLWFYFSPYGRLNVLNIIYAVLPIGSDGSDSHVLNSEASVDFYRFITSSNVTFMDCDNCVKSSFLSLPPTSQAICFAASPYFINAVFPYPYCSPFGDSALTTEDSVSFINASINPNISAQLPSSLSMYPFPSDLNVMNVKYDVAYFFPTSSSSPSFHSSFNSYSNFVLDWSCTCRPR